MKNVARCGCRLAVLASVSFVEFARIPVEMDLMHSNVTRVDAESVVSIGENGLFSPRVGIKILSFRVNRVKEGPRRRESSQRLSSLSRFSLSLFLSSVRKRKELTALLSLYFTTGATLR